MVDGKDNVVRLELPVDARYIRVARLVASGLGSTAGFDVDAVDDLRIAVDELCSALFELADGGPVSLSFALREDGVDVEGQTVAAPSAAIDPERFALSEQILGVACDKYALSVDGGVARFTLHKRA
jgi:serine/threonine-protein kinase RsbW